MSVLLAERADEILVLTLNRPAAANALDSALQGSLLDALADAAEDADIRAVVLAAQGERVFSAGADLKEFSELDRAAAGSRRRALLLKTLLAVVDFPKPLIAAVQARAIGAGAMLAVVADECLAAETVRFSFPEIALGMPSPLGCAVVAVRSSANLARRLIQTGENVESGRALALGLVDEVVPGDALRARSVERARLHGKRVGPAYAANKTWLNREMRAAMERAAEEGERLQHATGAGRSATNAA